MALRDCTYAFCMHRNWENRDKRTLRMAWLMRISQSAETSQSRAKHVRYSTLPDLLTGRPGPPMRVMLARRCECLPFTSSCSILLTIPRYPGQPAIRNLVTAFPDNDESTGWRSAGAKVTMAQRTRGAQHKHI
jgi:hypothetical protein